MPSAECIARPEELAARGRPVSFHVWEGEGHELAGFGPLPPFYRFVDGYEDLTVDFVMRTFAPGPTATSTDRHLDRPGE